MARRVSQRTLVQAPAPRASAGAGCWLAHRRLSEPRCLCTRLLLLHVPVARDNAKLRWQVHGVRHTRRGTVRKTFAFLPRALPGQSAPA
jgi:hypothetical protein